MQWKGQVHEWIMGPKSSVHGNGDTCGIQQESQVDILQEKPLRWVYSMYYLGLKVERAQLGEAGGVCCGSDTVKLVARPLVAGCRGGKELAPAALRAGVTGGDVPVSNLLNPHGAQGLRGEARGGCSGLGEEGRAEKLGEKGSVARACWGLLPRLTRVLNS
jgi:hypothetical protein